MPVCLRAVVRVQASVFAVSSSHVLVVFVIMSSHLFNLFYMLIGFVCEQKNGTLERDVPVSGSFCDLTRSFFYRFDVNSSNMRQV